LRLAARTRSERFSVSSRSRIVSVAMMSTLL
jgi:hypothetical protein